MDQIDAQTRLDGFLDRFTPAIAALARAIIARMRARLPGATIPIYDNYNALAVGFGPSEKASDIIFSVAVFPRWVSLFLTNGPSLDDPAGLLKGDGTRVRHIVLTGADMLEDPRIEALIAQALSRARKPIDPAVGGGVVIKSISAKQRPRRPANG